MKTVILFSVFFSGCITHHNLYPKDTTIIKGQLDWQKTFYFNRIKEFKNNPIGKNKIVFLGNSIIKGGGDWNKRFKKNNIVNRGISGDYTLGILNRLDEIIFYKPIAVFIMIGINEFFADNTQNPHITPEYVANNIFKIADIIKSQSPNTKIFIYTILPINNNQYIEVKNVDYNFLHNNFTPSVNDQVKRTNTILKTNKNFTVIDLYSSFINNKENMNKNMSSDGVHLNENGYDLWVQENLKLITSLNNN